MAGTSTRGENCKSFRNEFHLDWTGNVMSLSMPLQAVQSAQLAIVQQEKIKKRLAIVQQEKIKKRLRDKREEHGLSAPSAGQSFAHIKNKQKRSQMVSLMRQDKKKQKAKVRRARKEAEARGEEATDGHSQVQRQEPRSIDKMRECGTRGVGSFPVLQFVEEDEAMDEFEKILVTTQQKPSKKCFDFLKELVRSLMCCISYTKPDILGELVNVIPNTFYYPRRDFPFKKICEYATNKDFTDVMLFHEKAKVNLEKSRQEELSAFEDMKGGATCNASRSRRLARQFAALFPQRTVTFHNQRDFIFFRHYRYVFKEDGTKCKLQEIGPRFTMKCRYLQHGTFDAKEGEYEFIWRPDSQVSRKKFFAASSVSTSLGIQVILALVFVALVCLE
ncbi:Ribosome production factor 1 [Symbiodinium microadriaticum]|uniref:Ribosome production factor 1 n=1 Tax=Symbiodinium microadriaticum TaxID=2951 RepID=A0A1Q9F158_SYMMI|nr:Ribosome production factor 1 [Symbiodinium microadriaticum]